MENKRIWAMVGVIYMILATLLSTYWIATTTFLTGITGIMTFPLCAGLAAQCLNHRWKLLHPQEGAPPLRGNPRILLLLGILLALAALAMLVSGIGQLAAQFS